VAGFATCWPRAAKGIAQVGHPLKAVRYQPTDPLSSTRRSSCPPEIAAAQQRVFGADRQPFCSGRSAREGSPHTSQLQLGL
jgi:hypothetical protein